MKNMIFKRKCFVVNSYDNLSFQLADYHQTIKKKEKLQYLQENMEHFGGIV